MDSGFQNRFCDHADSGELPSTNPNRDTTTEGSWDKSNHLAAFITLAFLLDFSTSGNSIKWLGLAGYGMLIEVAQWFTEYRYFELSDILADCIGIAIYVILRGQLARTPWFGTLRHTLDNTLDKTLKDNI